MRRKKSLAVRLRAFWFWQELGFFPWRKEKKARRQRKKENPFESTDLVIERSHKNMERNSPRGMSRPPKSRRTPS